MKQLIILGFLSFLQFSVVGQSKSINVRLILDDLCCDKENDNPSKEDEIYYSIAGITSKGKEFKLRIPNEGEWDMDDDRSKSIHCLKSGQLGGQQFEMLSLTLEEGESVTLLITLMESDGARPQEAFDFASGILGSINYPPAQLAAIVTSTVGHSGLFDPHNDLIGSFRVKATNQNGQLTSDWQAVKDISGTIPNIGNTTNSFEFRMNGDNSNYVGWYYLKQ